MTLPVALSGTDVIGQAKTGTGKTLGFGLPLLERVTVPADVEAGRAKPEDLTDAPQALVVVPTRELCTQVTNDLLTAGKVRNVRVTAIYGGRAYEPQVEALKKGVDVVIGTPGRLLDLAGQKKLDLKHVKCLVLDEADEMLDLGFLPDVEKIIGMLPARRQTMLFSATMPGAVIGLARRYMSQPTHIRATAPDDEGATVANTSQHIYRAHNMDKPEMVARILQADGRGLAMVFCRTKRTAADLADQLKQRGFASGAVHGDLGQGAREQALRAFRNGKVDVLVCTDVAARGIDVEGVTHVINYQSPEDEKTYLHRIGRTGRAGAKGIAITLVDWDDIPRWQLINKALDLGFNDPPETYSTSPHLFEELNIPAGTKGVLPRSERTRAGLDAEELEDLGEPGGRGPRGRGGRSSGPSSSPSSERERPARTPRRRRRTRGGSAVDGAPAEATTAIEPAQPTATPGTAPLDSEPRTPRRRRRTRAGAAPAAETAQTVLDTAEDAPTKAEADKAAETVQAVEETPKPRRRRTRGGATAAGEAAETAVKTAEGTPAESDVPAAEAVQAVEEAEATKPRRRTRKTASTEPAAALTAETAEAALDTAESTPPAEATKPRRRTRKAAATVEAAPVAPVAEDAVAAEEAAPKRRRTRKAAEAVVEAPEAVITEPTATTEAPAKPRRRTRKTAEAVVDAPEAVTVEPTVEEVVPKPRRRTRKTAEAVVEAPEAVITEPTATTEAPAKPRRRTRKAAEAVVDAPEAVTVEPTVEEVVPKPRRRTRKTTEAVAEAPEAVITEPTATTEAPAKPRRRTRKAAEAVVEVAEGTVEAAVDGDEAAKPRRRTRKAAATATVPAQPTEEQATKPRRTRKAAAAVVEEAAEAPAPRRRTRKAAAVVEPTDS
ncbi:DEAD/DEAH box helicase [Streptomyces ipomoeae]|uniref:DEAD/DEAH box helicase n=1 Tax=Streptomyces ipomoeae TaxID=103232 RepID=UPI00114645F1|nr:DEAD/DEAH box helicase [Streptomyces ipomoeae]MDX2934116.1 DEAD/DEAH box helicase [Streptomyces ipomoeae]TQE16922.1 DEAD/DEAH box helicase [Streptomyces ipomoeae]